MKEATGEMNMTVVTIIAVGAIIAFFWFMWPTIKNTISGQWGGTSKDCGPDMHYVEGSGCVTGSE